MSGNVIALAVDGIGNVYVTGTTDTRTYLKKNLDITS